MILYIRYVDNNTNMRGPPECDFFGFGPMRHHHHFRNHPFGRFGHHGSGHHGHHGPRGHFGPWMMGPLFTPFGSNECKCSEHRKRTEGPPGPGHHKKGPCSFEAGPMDGHGCRGFGPWGKGCHRRGGEDRPGSPERDAPSGPGCPMEGPCGRRCHRRGDQPGSPERDGPRGLPGCPWGRGCHRRGGDRPRSPEHGPYGPPRLRDGPFGRGPWGRGCHRHGNHHHGRPERDGPTEGPDCCSGDRCRRKCGRKGSKEGNKGCSCNDDSDKDQGAQVIIERVIVENDARCKSV